MTEFDKLVARAYKHAQKKMHREGEVWPTWFIIGPDDHELVKVTAWGAIEDRRRVTAAMSFAMRTAKAQRFVLIAECWMAGPRNEEDVAQLMQSQESIADRPDRQEVVIVIGEDTSGERISAWAEIQRAEGGRPRLGAMQRWDDSILTHLSGLLIDIPEQTRH